MDVLSIGRREAKILPLQDQNLVNDRVTGENYCSLIPLSRPPRVGNVQLEKDAEIDPLA
jgi:hypothetical protein